MLEGVEDQLALEGVEDQLAFCEKMQATGSHGPEFDKLHCER
jgi:hypothetical protein